MLVFAFHLNCDFLYGAGSACLGRFSNGRGEGGPLVAPDCGLMCGLPLSGAVKVNLLMM